MNVPFFRLDCGENELRYIQEVLTSGWLTTGAKAVEFEEKFADAVGAKHALAVNSCTAALHLGCEAAGIGPGSEVLVPSLTFTATAEVVEYLGGTVRLVDVDPKSGLLTPDILKNAITKYPNLNCVMPVHFAGQVADMRGDSQSPGIMDICDENSIAVVEDAAHAFPARYKDESPVGSGIGSVATCFSFYANKTITCGEGGMLCTQDDEVASRVRQMRLHGIDRTIWDRFTSTKAKWEYDVIAPGYKYNLPDLAAAVGLAQLERANQFHRRRQEIVTAYRKQLQDCPGLRLPPSEAKSGDHAAAQDWAAAESDFSAAMAASFSRVNSARSVSNRTLSVVSNSLRVAAMVCSNWASAKKNFSSSSLSFTLSMSDSCFAVSLSNSKLLTAAASIPFVPKAAAAINTAPADAASAPPIPAAAADATAS